MVKMNIIVVYHKDEDKILMCLRKKEPYKGLYNLVGGKIDPGEDGLASAYRELAKETGIVKKDVELLYIMNFKYYTTKIELQVYAGKLNREIELIEELNKLSWIDTTENFFDMSKFAGEGNIGHILEQIKKTEFIHKKTQKI